MPGGTGLQLLEKGACASAGPAGHHHDGLFRPGQRRIGLQRGAFEYLPKPFDLPKAVRLIRRAVQESQREDVAQESQDVAPEMLGRPAPCRTFSAPLGD